MSTEISPPATSSTTSSKDRAAGSTRDRSLPKNRNLTGAGAEAIDSILWRLKAKQGDGSALVCGVTSCEPRAGSSTIANTLAQWAAQQTGTRVLLIDASDGHRSRSRKKVQCNGLNEILSGEVAPLECPVAALGENIDLICMQATTDSDNRMEDRLIAEMLHEFSTHYDTIVVDLPVASNLKKTLPLARHLPGVLLVVRSENAQQLHTQKAVDQLSQDGVSLYGTVLNGYRNFVPRWLRKWF